MRIAMGIEYDGQHFQGWQFLGAARDVRTVQGVLMQAIGSVANHPVEITCAGRTDAGVHAWGQVIHFDTDANRTERGWILGVNSALPADVSVTWVRIMPVEFDARRAATARRYRYIILNTTARGGLLAGRVTWDYRKLDAETMASAALHLIGEHDFSAYRSSECQSQSTVRRLNRLEIVRHGDYVILDIEANAFLHHMVRNIVGVLADIGAGRREPVWAREVLATRDRRQGGVTAPAAGLYLMRVDYPAIFDVPAPRAGWWPAPAA
jgi:tRNA pseudouridine38-40 synthase